MRLSAFFMIFFLFPTMLGLAQVPYGSVQNPAQIPYDVQFLDTLAQHNRDAINLMQLAQMKARSPQVKAMAHILYERQAEFPGLNQIRRRLGGYLPPYVNLGMPGMISVEPELARLSTTSADQFDREFLKSAIMIQQGGIQLCDDALAKSRDPSVRGMASLIRNKLGQSLVALQQIANTVG